jgi:hypothetical protein
MARRMGFFSGFALTKFSVNVSNILAQSEIIRIDDLSVHSQERRFSVQFCMECWKAEHTPESAAGIYLTAFYGNGMRYPDGTADSKVTVRDKIVVMSDAMIERLERVRRERGD